MQNKHPPSWSTGDFDYDENIDLLKLNDVEINIFNKIDRIDYFILQEFLEIKYKEK